VRLLKKLRLDLVKIYSDTTLKYEEERSKFLSREISKIKAVSSDGKDKETLIFEQVAASKLAKHIRDIYTSIKSDSEFRLFINDWMICQANLKPTKLPIEIRTYQSLLLLEIPHK
jgi:hypothetical protein